MLLLSLSNGTTSSPSDCDCSAARTAAPCRRLASCARHPDRDPVRLQRLLEHRRDQPGRVLHRGQRDEVAGADRNGAADPDHVRAVLTFDGDATAAGGRRALDLHVVVRGLGAHLSRVARRGTRLHAHDHRAGAELRVRRQRQRGGLRVVGVRLVVPRPTASVRLGVVRGVVEHERTADARDAAALQRVRQRLVPRRGHRRVTGAAQDQVAVERLAVAGAAGDQVGLPAVVRAQQVQCRRGGEHLHVRRDLRTLAARSRVHDLAGVRVPHRDTDVRTPEQGSRQNRVEIAGQCLVADCHRAAAGRQGQPCRRNDDRPQNSNFHASTSDRSPDHNVWKLPGLSVRLYVCAPKKSRCPWTSAAGRRSERSPS